MEVKYRSISLNFAQPTLCLRSLFLPSFIFSLVPRLSFQDVLFYVVVRPRPRRPKSLDCQPN